MRSWSSLTSMSSSREPILLTEQGRTLHVLICIYKLYQSELFLLLRKCLISETFSSGYLLSFNRMLWWVIRIKQCWTKVGSTTDPLAGVWVPGFAFCMVCVYILLLLCRTRPEDGLIRSLLLLTVWYYVGMEQVLLCLQRPYRKRFTWDVLSFLP